MWHIVQSEIKYNRYLFAVFISMVPLNYIALQMFQDIPNFFLLILMFLMLQNWLIIKNKERREYRDIQLPMSLPQIGMARIVIIVTGGVCVITLDYFINIIFSSKNAPLQINTLIYLGIILCGFSVYFIFRDLMLPFLRRIGLTKTRMIAGLMVMALIMNLLGVCAFFITKSSGKPPKLIEMLIYFIKNYNPFFGEYGLVKLVIFGICLSGLSVYTYMRRKTYLE